MAILRSLAPSAGIVFVSFVALFALLGVSIAKAVAIASLLGVVGGVLTLLFMWACFAPAGDPDRARTIVEKSEHNHYLSEFARMVSGRAGVEPISVRVVTGESHAGEILTHDNREIIVAGKDVLEHFGDLEWIGFIAHEVAHNILPLRHIAGRVGVYTLRYDAELMEYNNLFLLANAIGIVLDEDAHRRFAWLMARSSVPVRHALESAADVVGCMLIGHAFPVQLALLRCGELYPALVHGDGWTHPSIAKRVLALRKMDSHELSAR